MKSRARALGLSRPHRTRPWPPQPRRDGCHSNHIRHRRHPGITPAPCRKVRVVVRGEPSVDSLGDGRSVEGISTRPPRIRVTMRRPVGVARAGRSTIQSAPAPESTRCRSRCERTRLVGSVEARRREPRQLGSLEHRPRPLARPRGWRARGAGPVQAERDASAAQGVRARGVKAVRSRRCEAGRHAGVARQPKRGGASVRPSQERRAAWKGA